MVDQLVITGINVPPFSTRAALQQIQPIDAATQVARTVNGELIDLSDIDEIFRQFVTTISGTDMQAPEFIWPGQTITIHCLARFWKKTVGGVFIRSPVPDSEVVDGDYTSYRPILVCKVISWTDQRDDWNANHTWQLVAEETIVPEVVTT